MPKTRASHTATLLNNGKVLVAGGVLQGVTDLKTAVLYDAASATWAATGSMAATRERHTANLLADGRVLVTGGAGLRHGDFTTLATSELYDPLTGSWSPTGNLQIGRYAHTATTLLDGRVLVAGGYNYANRQTLDDVEIYNPQTGTWSTTASLNIPRSGHTATLLADGRVLVAGGQNDTVLASSEIYDPASGTWTLSGNLKSARHDSVATRLEGGKVLVEGGLTVSSGQNIVLRSAELYNPQRGTWTTVPPMANKRYEHQAILLPSGLVVVTGGSDEFSVHDLATVEIYDPLLNNWTSGGNMNAGHQAHSATLLPDGTILVAGGFSNGSWSALAEIGEVAGSN